MQQCRAEDNGGIAGRVARVSGNGQTEEAYLTRHSNLDSSSSRSKW